LSSIAALVLAGGKIGSDLEPVAEGATNRALIRLGGRPMLDYVLEATRGGLARAGGGRILVAGEVPIPPDAVAVLGGASMVDTLFNGAAALAPDETRMLVVTADAPFLTGEAIADFLRRAREAGGGDVQFAYAIVEAARCRERFPEMKRTTLRVAEGEYTGGCLALLDPSFLRSHEAVLRGAYANRKNVAGLAKMMGPSLLLRLLLSRIAPAALPIPVLEEGVGRLLGGAKARAVVSPYPEVGADVDKAEDVVIARRMFAAEVAPPDGRAYNPAHEVNP